MLWILNLIICIIIWKLHKKISEIDHRVSYLEHKTRRNLAHDHIKKPKK